MERIVNDKVIGTEGQDTLVNNKSGYTKLTGKKGNDIYVIEDISNSYTEIDDGDSVDDLLDPNVTTNENGIVTEDYGSDIVKLRNIKPNDLAVFFDVSLENYEPEFAPYDDMIVLKKSQMESVLEQFITLEETWTEMEDEYITMPEDELENLILNVAAPQSGAVYIPYQFGDVNNGGTQLSAGAIEDIQIEDIQGNITSLDIESYIANVKPAVLSLLTEVYELGLKDAQGFRIQSAIGLLLSDHAEYITRLMDIYKGQNFVEEDFENPEEPEAPEVPVVPENPVDTVHIVEKGVAKLEGTSGVDRYNTFFSSTDVSIFDKGGEDLLLLDGVNGKKGQSLNFFFDVSKSAGGHFEPNLIILKDSNIQNYVLNSQKARPKVITGSLEIQNFLNNDPDNSNLFSDGFIETIRVAQGTDGDLVNVEEYFQRVIGEVRTWLNKNGFNSAMEALTTCRDKRALNELIGIYTKELCPIELIYSEMLEEGYTGVNYNEFFGGNGNEVIYSYNDTMISAGKGNDKLYRGTYNHDNEENTAEISVSGYTLRGEDGNDVLEAGKNVLIDGGRGENAILVDSESDVTILQGRGQDYIHLVEDSIDDFEFTKDGDTLIMEAEGGAKITLKDYFRYNAKSSIKGITDDCTSYTEDDYADKIVADIKKASAGNTIGDILSRESAELDIVPIPVKNTINGTNYNDNIDASELTLTKTIGKGKNKQTIDRVATDSGLTINGGNGDDEIYGTQYSDIIKGGNGNNELFGEDGNDKIYAGNGLENLIEGNTGNDTIYCEKGNSEIRFYTNDGDDIIYTGRGNDSLVFEETSLDALTYELNRNDLIINHGNGDSVRIANYFKAKGNTSIKTIQGSDSLNAVDLNQQVISKGVILNGEFNRKNKLSGTYMSDTINGRNLNDTLLGGNGDDTLYGGAGNDTIKGGNDDDDIYGNAGDDRLYGEAGENKFYFSVGDGNDSVFSGRGNDSLVFDGINLEDITFGVNKKNLVIEYGNQKDSVQIVDYFKLKDNGSVKTIITADYPGGIDLKEHLETVEIVMEGRIDRKNKITGSYLSDIITGGNHNDTLNGSIGCDTIYGANGHDTIMGGDDDDILYGGAGNDTIKGGNDDDDIYGNAGDDRLYGEAGENGFHFYNGDGDDTIYMGRGEDTIYLESEQETAPTYIRKGNNLVITYGDDDTITVANYFKSKYTSVKTVEYALYNSVLGYYENKTDVISDDIIVQGEIEDSISKSYTGNDKNNLIYTNGKIGYVAAGGGNDTIQINNSVGAIVDGGFGDDYYEINSLKKSILIDDAGGTDKLWINEKSNNINVLFDVSADGSKITGDFSSMLIINDANYKTLKRYWDFDRVTAGTEVLDGDSAIEYIYSKNNQMIDVNKLRGEIATWLTSSGRNYVSAMDVLDQGDSDDIEVLLQMYQDAWEPAN